jgi:S1-C subfamily serine protease
MIVRTLLGLALIIQPAPLAQAQVPPNANPTLNLSAVRFIVCDNQVASGFLIGDKMLLTANHVLDGQSNCFDAESGSPLIMYKQDRKHDIALATGPKLPTDIPYIKISCEPFKKNQPYFAYGVSPYWQSRPILRENTVIAVKPVKDSKIYNEDGSYVVWQNMWKFNGAIAPGMSGGPVVDMFGYVHAIVNAGDSRTSLLFQLSDGMMCKR